MVMGRLGKWSDKIGFFPILNDALRPADAAHPTSRGRGQSLLPLTRLYVYAHDGQFHVDSILQCGTTLPMVVATPD